MASKNATRSLHIQNDQTDTAGVYQHNRGADLFMSGPGGIREFTDWDDKATSLGSPDLPAAAFDDSPYNYTRAKDYPELELEWWDQATADASFLGGREIPSSIEIADDVAFVSHKKFSPEVYSYIAKLEKDKALIKRVYRQARLPDHNASYTWIQYGPAFIEDVGTYADCEELLDRSQSNKGISAKFKLGDYTFYSGLSVHSHKSPWVGTLKEITDDYLHPTDCDKKFLGQIGDRSGFRPLLGGGRYPDFFGDDFPDFPVDPDDLQETMQYFTQSADWQAGIVVTDNFKGFYFPLFAGFSLYPSHGDILDNFGMDREDVNVIDRVLIGSETVVGGSPYSPREYTIEYYEETFMVSGEDGYYYKTGRVHEAGRVDTYRRKGGSIKSIDAATEEVVLQDSFGTIQSYLEDGDKIKMSSVLNADSQKGVNHPLNGIKYVKKLSEVQGGSSSPGYYNYNTYHIYDDEQLTVRTDVTGYRDITSSVWTYYGSTLSAAGTWEYAETLFQQDSRAYYLNGVDMEDALRDQGAGAVPVYISKINQLKGILKNSTVFSDVADYAALAPIATGSLDIPFLDPDGFKTVPESFWFGHAIAIKDKKVAISEIGNNYSYFCGRDLYGNTGGVIYLDIEGDVPFPIGKFSAGMKLQPALRIEGLSGTWDTGQTQSGLLHGTEFVTGASSLLEGSIKATGLGSETSEGEGYTEYGWTSLKDPLQYQHNDGRGRVCLFTIKSSAEAGFNYTDNSLSKKAEDPKSVLTLDALIDASTTNPFIYSGTDNDGNPMYNNALKVGTGLSKLNLLIHDFRDIYWVNCVEKTDPTIRFSDDLWWDYDNNTLVHFDRNFNDSEFYRNQILRYERDNLIGNYSGRTSGFLYSDNFGFQLCFGEDDLLYVSNRAPHYAAPESIAADLMLMSEGLTLDEATGEYTTTPRATNLFWPPDGSAPYEAYQGSLAGKYASQVPGAGISSDNLAIDKGQEDTISRYTKTSSFMLDFHNDNSSSIQAVPTRTLVAIGPGTDFLDDFSPAYTAISSQMSLQSLKYDYMPSRDIPYDMSYRNGRLIVGVGQSPHGEDFDGNMLKVFDKGSATYTTHDVGALAVPIGILPISASSASTDQLPTWLTAGSNIDGPSFTMFTASSTIIPDASKPPISPIYGPNGEINDILIKFNPGDIGDGGSKSPRVYSAALDGTVANTAWYYKVIWWWARDNEGQHSYVNCSLYNTPGHALTRTRSDYNEIADYEVCTIASSPPQPIGCTPKGNQPEQVNIYNEYSESYIFSDMPAYPDVSSGSSGYNFRSDGDLLVTHIHTDQNEFGEITTAVDRLAIFEVSKPVPSLLQIITPCVEKMEAGNDDIGFREGAITFNESLSSSYTLDYSLQNRYDIISDKIVLSFPDGYAIFLDSGKSPSPIFEGREYTQTLRPYLSFAENFTQSAPYNLNNIYEYRYGAGYLYPDVVYDINDNQKGLCYLYNIPSLSREGALTRLASLKFTVNTQEGTSEVKPLIGIHTDDPRAAIVQKGFLGGDGLGALNDTLQYNNDVPLYENGLQDTFGRRVVPTYVADGLGDDIGAPFTGTATLDGVDAYPFITSGTKIKDSTYNRTIRNNDGTGYIGGTYLYEFDDSSKDSFNPPVNGNVDSTLVVSLTSQGNTGESGGSSSSSDAVRAFCVPDCVFSGRDYNCGQWSPWVVQWDAPDFVDRVDSQHAVSVELWSVTKNQLVVRRDCVRVSGRTPGALSSLIFPTEEYGITDCDDYMVKLWVWRSGCDQNAAGFPELIFYDESDEFSCCGDQGIGYRLSRRSIQRDWQYHLAPYGKSGPGNPDPSIYEHDDSNNAKLSALATFKEYDLGRIRRFSCSYFTENSEVGGGSIVRLGKTRDNFSPALYDEPSTILVGTSSKSVQVISHHESDDSIPRFDTQSELSASKYADAAIYNYRQSHFDTQYPESLSLMIQSNPTNSNSFDMSTGGVVAVTGSMPLYIDGVAHDSSSMALHFGTSETKAYMGLFTPQPLGFECASFRLHMPTPVGDSVSSSAPISFAGGSGVNQGLNLLINPLTYSDSMNLAVGQPVPSSGDMTIAVSGVHGTMNTIPCIEGNLFINSVIGSGTENMPLHINRSSLATGIPLHMTAPNPVSGIFALNMNTEPFNSDLPLSQRGYESSTSSASLYVGRQLDAKTLPTYIAGPIEHNSDMSLYVSGNVLAVTPSNSVDNNYEHQCLLGKIENRFDYSSNSEMIVSDTKTNSISRNRLTGSSRGMGYYTPAEVGSTLKAYFPTYASNYYNTEVARDCIDSNSNYIAIASNVTSLSSSPSSLYIYEILDQDSVKLKFEYDKIRADLVTLGVLGSTDYSAKIFYKSVSVSDLNKVAVSVRMEVPSGLYDVVCILQPATISTTTSKVSILDPCATDSGEELVVSTEEIDGWSMTNAFISSALSTDETSPNRLNKTIGSSTAWHNEDLYFDKQDTSYASVFSAHSSEEYAYEHKPMPFSTLSDGIGYYSNRNRLLDGTKVGFGSVIKIFGDFAFVGAPMLDPHVAKQSLPVISASSPEGAVYIYKYDGGWSHTDTVYSGGYTSQNISGATDCGYSAKLFGYNFDFNLDSGYLSVGEPMTNKIYRFEVNSSGVAALISSYTDSKTGFGETINNCSRSILAGTTSTIIDPVYGTDFQYSDSDIKSEAEQYVGGALIENVDHSIYFTKHVKMSGKNKLLVGRVFDVSYGHSASLQIEKISLLSLGETHGNLFIKGPTGVNSSLQGLSLTMRPYENKTATLGLQFASFGLSSGIPLHMEVASSSTLAMPMHMRANTEIKIPLFLKSEYTDVSSTAPIAISGPNGTTLAGDLSIPSGHDLSSHSTSAFVLGSTGSDALFGAPLSIKQDDLIPASGAQNLRTEGVGAGVESLTGSESIYMFGGNTGPASGVTTLAIQTDASAPVSGSTTLVIKLPPATGDLTDALNIYVSGAGVNAAAISAGAMGLHTSSTVAASGITSLVLYRRGVGGGYETESNAPLTVANFIDSSTADVYISGGHKSSNSMNLSIPSGLGVPTTSGTLFTRGYIE